MSVKGLEGTWQEEQYDTGERTDEKERCFGDGKKMRNKKSYDSRTQIRKWIIFPVVLISSHHHDHVFRDLLMEHVASLGVLWPPSNSSDLGP